MVDEAAEADVLEQDDRELIHSIFEWGETVVREVMIPRTDMITIDDDEDVSARDGPVPVVGRLAHAGRRQGRGRGARHPVPARRRAAQLREAARAEQTPVRDLARPAVFVPESKKADDTLRQMQLDSNHLAMVVDEYGGIAGLVTMEDLIEELVGDISDEYDRDLPDVDDLGGGVFRVSARLPKDELGDLFGIELDDDDVDSAGGLLTKAIGRLPEAGSRAVVSGLVLRADRIEGRRKQLRTLIVERDQALHRRAGGVRQRREEPRMSEPAVPLRLRHVRRPPERRQVDADERPGRREGRDHVVEAADHAARDPRHHAHAHPGS